MIYPYRTIENENGSMTMILTNHRRLTFSAKQWAAYLARTRSLASSSASSQTTDRARTPRHSEPAG